MLGVRKTPTTKHKNPRPFVPCGFGLFERYAIVSKSVGIYFSLTPVSFFIIELIFQEPHKSILVRQDKFVLAGENLRIVLR